MSLKINKKKSQVTKLKCPTPKTFDTIQFSPRSSDKSSEIFMRRVARPKLLKSIWISSSCFVRSIRFQTSRLMRPKVWRCLACLIQIHQSNNMADRWSHWSRQFRRFFTLNRAMSKDLITLLLPLIRSVRTFLLVLIIWASIHSLKFIRVITNTSSNISMTWMILTMTASGSMTIWYRFLFMRIRSFWFKRIRLSWTSSTKTSK